MKGNWALFPAMRLRQIYSERDGANNSLPQWQSFEHGRRNCLAQGLVLTELRVVLAFATMKFDFKPADEEYDQLYPRKGLKTY